MIILNAIAFDNSHIHWDRFSKPKETQKIEFKFKPGVNVVIGHNGAGKSTLLKSVREYLFGQSQPDGIHISSTKSDDKEMVYFFMSEDNIPSLNLNQITPFDQNFMHKTVYWMDRKEMSSGMNTNAMLKEAERLSKEASLVFFDEPEQALDAKAMIQLQKMIKKIAKHSQVVLVTHHPALILMKGVNIIEINEEQPYLDDVKTLVSGLM
ncbi:ATP-binding cassette domain-containing protein [Vibrio antiquarius]|uniref:ABC transporter ATP-binding protein n=1 Tax=Vibrio parahaemolyticus TaxID=670 RepID=A0AA46UQP4_VIBPH|nr:ABC transporter ATP-binding protein [Vibrio parahaemolyticus]UYV29901.1 ABC transporter ATP-binding protein [Vibrio parahaemolyticus]UYW19058.1 AAA family ATPase [Vibrio parahaemolyticus]